MNYISGLDFAMMQLLILQYYILILFVNFPRGLGVFFDFFEFARVLALAAFWASGLPRLVQVLHFGPSDDAP